MSSLALAVEHQELDVPPADAGVVDAQVGLGAAAEHQAGWHEGVLGAVDLDARPRPALSAVTVGVAGHRGLRPGCWMRKRPVERSSALSNPIVTGPGNT